jgi:hypothetical protein
MADTITFRPDEDTSKALEVLTKDGTAVSAAVRSALIDAARRKASAAIRAEAERLAEDESDRTEAMQVLRNCMPRGGAAVTSSSVPGTP